MPRGNFIFLTAHEMQSGSTRQDHAENLILQLPMDHDGRNTWLLNYGVKEEAVGLRAKQDLLWVPNRRAAEMRDAQLKRQAEE